MGAANKPIRLMTGLIILKHIRDVSDESIVEQLQENAYYQYFSQRFWSRNVTTRTRSIRCTNPM